MGGDGAGLFEFGKDRLGELLAEFHTPLIKRVDVPDDALGENLVLVEGDQSAERLGRELGEHDRVGGTIAGEDFVRDEFFERVAGEAVLGQFLADFFGGLALHQRFGLREEVGEEDEVMLAERILRLDGRDEIGGDELVALVDELVERVLAIGAGLAPDDGAAIDVERLAFAVDALAVAFHVALLEVGGEAVHVLVVGKNRDGARAEEIVVPDADEAERHGEIFLRRRVEEVLVHRVRAFEHLDEFVVADAEDDGQADGAPERVTAADPVPEAEHIGGVDAEFLHVLLVGGKRDEMFGDVGFVLRGLEEPIARGVGIGDGLLRGKGLRRDDEERGLGRELLQRLGHVGAVDVGDEMGAEVFLRVGLERLGDHDGAEVGAADADVDEVGDGLAGVAFPFAGADGVGEFFHVGEDGIDLGHDVLAIDEDGAIRAIAERDVEDGAIFSDIDFLAGEHLLGHAVDVLLNGERAEQADRFIGDPVLGEIEKEVAEFEREFLEALGVLREEVAHLHVLLGFVVGEEIFPGRGGGEGAHDIRAKSRKGVLQWDFCATFTVTLILMSKTITIENI